MQGRPLRISGDLSIRVPISIATGIRCSIHPRELSAFMLCWPVASTHHADKSGSKRIMLRLTLNARSPDAGLPSLVGEVHCVARNDPPLFDPEWHFDTPRATCDFRADVDMPLFSLNVEHE